MTRNKALIELAPGQILRMSEGRLGVFFCGETFTFVLDPLTRRAAERVARWHGCEFRFYPATGCTAFVKKSPVCGMLVSVFESAIQWFEHMTARARLYAQSFKLRSLMHTRAAAAS